MRGPTDGDSNASTAAPVAVERGSGGMICAAIASCHSRSKSTMSCLGKSSAAIASTS